MEPNFTRKLKERISNGNFRQLVTSPETCSDFASNDYLGLSRSKALFNKIQNYSYDHITNLNGSPGSRLLAGNSEQVQSLETKLAGIFNGESALLFNSGYMANLALISCLPQRGDTIIYDSLAHVCIKEGAQLSLARSFSFKHNDIQDLENKLKRVQGQKFVIIESVYSMDGDEADFKNIIDIAEKHEAFLIVDEAHGTGLFGEKGNGKVCEMNLENHFLGRVYTFGKAMGVHGACIIGSREMIDYLTNFARSFIYTTALPVHSIFSIDAAFDFLHEHTDLQEEIKSKIDFFIHCYDQKIGLNNYCSRIASITPIQPIIIPGNKAVKEAALEFQKNGFDVRPILSPTVAAGSERLRVCLHTHNSHSEIENLIDCLSSRL